MKIILLFIGLFYSIGIYAQDTLQFTPLGLDSASLNEFRYIGGAIGCISDKLIDTDKGYVNCLHIGNVKMKMSIIEVEEILGEPKKVIDQNESQVRVYLLPTSEKYYPYFAVTFKNKIAKSLQLTGNSTSEDISFSSIRLGSYYKEVLELLGKPTNIQIVPDINGVEWTYYPFPISIEIINGKVYSIKINDK
jgi:hypothetical protein